MFAKKWLISAAVVGAALATTPANAAASIMCDSISNASSCVFGNSNPDTGENIDFFTFKIAAPKTLTGFLFTRFETIDQNVNFPRNGSWIEGGTLAGIERFAVTAGLNPDTGVIGPILLGAGTYNLRIRSFAGPNGVYSGSLSLASVPEPVTWALMILGFGLIGGTMRRRNASEQEGKLAYA